MKRYKGIRYFDKDKIMMEKIHIECCLTKVNGTDVYAEENAIVPTESAYYLRNKNRFKKDDIAFNYLPVWNVLKITPFVADDVDYMKTEKIV